jgi:uncharacterized repeat protein (TIGR01451 family)
VNGPLSTSTETKNGLIKVLEQADLAVTMADAPDPVSVGANLTYTVQATNTGPDAATPVTVTDTLPAGVAFVSATASQGGCTQTAGTVTCALGTLASGTNAEVQIVVTPSLVGTVTNTATIASDQVDPIPATNTATASTTVIAVPAPSR